MQGVCRFVMRITKIIRRFSFFRKNAISLTVIKALLKSMDHYYFKFGIANEKFEELIEKKVIQKKVSEKIPLSIYFWQDGVDGKADYLLKSKAQKKQVNAFFDVDKKPKEIYFWIFYREKIFCYQAENGKIFNGDEQYPCLISEREINKKFRPKSMIAVCEKIYEKVDLPEVFANINSNQSYNRGTIKKIRDSEKEIADSLINNEKISINRENYFNFLSSVELETLIFLIFNTATSFCSSFRGGTLKDFDLKVSLSDNLYSLEKGDHWIQVKHKDNEGKQKNHNNTIFIDHNEDNPHGVEWLKEIIDGRPDIQRWLKGMTFKYEMYDTSCFFENILDN